MTENDPTGEQWIQMVTAVFRKNGVSGDDVFNNDGFVHMTVGYTIITIWLEPKLRIMVWPQGANPAFRWTSDERFLTDKEVKQFEALNRLSEGAWERGIEAGKEAGSWVEPSANVHTDT